MRYSDIDLRAFGHSIAFAGAVFQDANRTLLCMFPNAQRDLPVESVDINLPEWEALLRQIDLLEVEVLNRSSDGVLAKIILRKSQRTIETGIQWAVFRRDGYACRWCGADDVPLTVDHIIPWEELGPSTMANLVAACRKCNKTRATTSLADWLKSDWYTRHAHNLTPAKRAMNEALISTLDQIPRIARDRSR